MKLNDTQKRVLAGVFGKADPEVTVAGPPSAIGYFVNPGSREWTFACELHAIGVAKIIRREDGLAYCRRACNSLGPVALGPGEHEVVHPAFLKRQRHVNR